MTKALTEEQAAGLVPAHELQVAAMEERENTALFELSKLGFRVTLHELPQHVDHDPLTGQQEGWKHGSCYAVIYSIDGKRKHVSGISAVDALTQAQAWKTWQDGLKPDAPNRFIAAPDNEPTAVAVVQRTGSESARKERGRENVRVLAFDTGTPTLVDGHGTPIGDTTSPASQYREADSKETSR